MNARIAELLRDQIDDLNFVERTAGLVRSLPMKIETEDGAVTKNIPVALNNETPCEPEEMMALVPDSDKMSIIFFEDGGINITRRDSWYIHCESTLTMVAWFNLPMINPDYTDATLLMAHLVAAVPKYIDNDDFITRILVVPIGELDKETVYSQYDLDLAENMYFAFPYDYAAFQFNVIFAIPKNCLDKIIIDPDECFLK
ncbi:MAG TPA: hypothetical protein DEQ09_08940 [Bacteroidales bacterium]|nr:hypothetical protein [Bacteroidales bacterium]